MEAYNRVSETPPVGSTSLRRDACLSGEHIDYGRVGNVRRTSRNPLVTDWLTAGYNLFLSFGLFEVSEDWIMVGRGSPPLIPGAELIDEERQLCQSTQVSDEVFHTVCLQLWGVCREGSGGWQMPNPLHAFEEIHLRLPTTSMNGIDSVPRKLPVVPLGISPYIRTAGNIWYRERPIFAPDCVTEVPLPEGNRPRYLKGYSFPFMGTSTPYYELRLNPRNTGKCPGRCAFCHRGFSYRLAPPQQGRVFPPCEIVDSIVREHGPKCLSQIDHVSVITELFGKEFTFLSYLEQLKKMLLECGCKPGISIRACSQDVRTKEGLERLYSIIDHDRYSYTLEMFSRRRELMGGYKGIELVTVEAILETAKRVGFRTIKLNYVAGIDPIRSFELGIRRLRSAGLVDSLGLSIFTAFTAEQIVLRHQDAWRVSYYLRMLEVIKDIGVSVYEPTCFEMGYPPQLLEAFLVPVPKL